MDGSSPQDALGRRLGGLDQIQLGIELARQAFALRTDDSAAGTDYAFGAKAEYPNDRWRGMLAFRQIGENLIMLDRMRSRMAGVQGVGGSRVQVSTRNPGTPEPRNPLL